MVKERRWDYGDQSDDGVQLYEIICIEYFISHYNFVDQRTVACPIEGSVMG